MNLPQKSFAERFADRMRAVFSDHKTEMLSSAAIGFLIGAVIF